MKLWTSTSATYLKTMMNNDNNNPHGAIVYDYTDENGKLLYQKLRSDTKDFRFRQPTDGDGWLYHLDGVNPVLYNLPDVIKKDVIYIVEGEKDADNVKKELGLTATTPPFGAGKWDDSFNKYLETLPRDRNYPSTLFDKLPKK